MDYKFTSRLSEKFKQNDAPINLNSTIELHITDFQKAKDFYQELGFEIIFERYPEGFKGYLVMKLENNAICFWGGNENIYQQEFFKKFSKETPRGYGVEIILMYSKLDELYTKAKELNCIVEELKMKPWGVRDFRIVDPFGFYLRISDLHNIFSGENAVV
jgi:lactoylglutathione lyase